MTKRLINQHRQYYLQFDGCSEWVTCRSRHSIFLWLNSLKTSVFTCHKRYIRQHMKMTSSSLVMMLWSVVETAQAVQNNWYRPPPNDDETICPPISISLSGD